MPLRQTEKPQRTYVCAMIIHIGVQPTGSKRGRKRNQNNRAHTDTESIIQDLENETFD